MKKQLFKALAATAIVGAVMAMSSVVASAEPWLASDTSNIPEVFGFTFTNTTLGSFSSTRKGSFAEPIFDDGNNGKTGAVAGKSGIDINAQTDHNTYSKDRTKSDCDVDTGIKNSMSFIPQKSGIVKLYIAVDNSGDKSDCLRIYGTTLNTDPEYNGKYKRSSNTLIAETVYSGQKADNNQIQPFVLPVKANETYSIYAKNSKCYLMAAEFVEETEAKTTFKADNGSYYIVSVVTPEQAEAAFNLIQEVAVSATELGSTDTVYEKISIGGNELDATAFGGNAGDYLYATELTGVDANKADDAENEAIKYVLSVLE